MAHTDSADHAKLASEIASEFVEVPRRRALFFVPKIDPRFLKFFSVSYGCGAIAVVLLFTTGALYDMLFNGEDADMAAQDVLNQGAQFWLLLLAGTLLQIYLTLSFASRLSGMIVPFRRTVAIVNQGGTPPYIKLRHDDFLNEEVNLVNIAIFNLEEAKCREGERRKELILLREELRAEGLEQHAQSIEAILEITARRTISESNPVVFGA
ncbi:MAG: hypothetical protein ACI97A_001731 [Planctomycetota bacterium]|jgi:hypothetical protein